MTPVSSEALPSRAPRPASSVRKRSEQGAKQVQNQGHEPTDVRRAVLDATLAIIAADGPDAVSMREVARRAGVSHQAPYHYFGDRAGIFAAISEEGFTEFTTVLHDALATPDPLTSCLHAYVSFACSHLGHFKVMFRSDLSSVGTDSACTTAADNAFEVLNDLARIVQPEHAEGLDAFQLPILIWSQAHGLATLLIDGPLRPKLPTTLTIEEILSFVSPTFSRSIRAAIK